ncbi:metallophosphoesterase family protein [Actinoplanes sp. OR16]|uniref:purple acid phosphatase family protein n=1 Tax=Actinoplanes sp. OR16 TaxID=946334 RepID=UPI001E4D3FB8|nr:metallophosphoesterase family protein [Actinoplanes sp. OR16]
MAGLTIDEFSEWNTQRLARSAVSRRTLLKTAAAGYAYTQFHLASAAFAAGGGVEGPAGVVVSGRHLSFVPDPDGALRPAMALTAQLVSKTGSLPAKLRAFVDVGSAPGRYGTRFAADIRHLTGQYAIPGGPIGSQFYLKAVVDKLLPATVYYYRVRLSDGTVSGEAHFSTAPAKGSLKPFTFTAFADVGTNTAPADPKFAWHRNPASVTAAGGTWPAGVFDNNSYLPDDPVAGLHGTDKRPALTQTMLLATQQPVFTLLAGDICYANPSGSGLPADDTTALTRIAPKGKNLFNPYVWDVFLNQIEPLASSTPWMFATGNHDMEPIYGNTRFLGDSPAHGYGGLLERLDFPTNGPHTCPSVYRFAYGNVGLISLDANELSSELHTNAGYSNGAQVGWLRRSLKAWRADPAIDFIVVFLHHCAYATSDNHASDGGVRDALDPLFSEHQVDLVIQGHNHLLERTDPIRYGRRTRAAPDGSTIAPATDGVTYICVGSGGRPRYPFRRAPGKAAPAPAGVKVEGAQLLPAGQRYRGYRPPPGENTTTTIVNSYYWSAEKRVVKPAGHPTGIRVPETVDWSQVRYDAYAFIAVDVTPAARGARTSMTIRSLADALPGTRQPFTEIDRITLTRVAGT